MARYRGPVCRQCRTSGMKLFIKGERCNSSKCSMDRRKTKPGMHGAANKKQTEYAIQLREKQKIKNIYGLLENQFYKYYEEATRKEGITGELILVSLERRLDNIAYRLGLGKSRNQARQLVRHGHIKVNGKRVDIPSYRVKQGDVISVKEGSLDMDQIKDAKEGTQVPAWLSFDAEKVTGTVVELPKRENVDIEINEQLVVEFYSR